VLDSCEEPKSPARYNEVENHSKYHHSVHLVPVGILTLFVQFSTSHHPHGRGDESDQYNNLEQGYLRHCHVFCVSVPPPKVLTSTGMKTMSGNAASTFAVSLYNWTTRLIFLNRTIRTIIRFKVITVHTIAVTNNTRIKSSEMVYCTSLMSSELFKTEYGYLQDNS
jgi:hypothetical protein